MREGFLKVPNSIIEKYGYDTRLLVYAYLMDNRDDMSKTFNTTVRGAAAKFNLPPSTVGRIFKEIRAELGWNLGEKVDEKGVGQDETAVGQDVQAPQGLDATSRDSDGTTLGQEGLLTISLERSKTTTSKSDKPFELPKWIPEEPWNAWLKVRKKNTPYALRLAVKQLEKIKAMGVSPQDALERAILSSWQGIKADWFQQQANSQQSTQSSNLPYLEPVKR
jgi:hypothetical protein